MDPLSAFVRRSLDAMVHASAAGEGTGAARHRSFIAAHLVIGALALAALPLWLAFAGQPSLAVAIAFALLAVPTALAVHVSRTGRLESAAILSSFLMAAIVLWLAGMTGWQASLALVWLAVLPAEAALSGSRRASVVATLVAAAALAAIIVLPQPGWLAADPSAGLFAAVAGFAAVLHAGGLALRIDAIHRQSQSAMRDGEARYRLIAENANDLITRHGANGEIDFASPAARTLVGVSPRELEGSGFLRHVHVADRPKLLNGLSEAIRLGQPATIEFRLARAAAPGRPTRFLWVEMRCRPVPVAPGEPPMAVAVTRDISERRAQEEAAEAARDEAEETSAAKSRFLAHVSHELRTPLNAIIGFSEILERDRDDAVSREKRLEYAGIIRESGAHLLSVVNTLLDLSRIEAGRFAVLPEPFAVGPLVQSCLSLIGPQAEARGLRLEASVASGLPLLVADQRACRQILINLLANAVKFTEPGGRITVGARPLGRSVELFVQDTGIGIAEAELPHLGEPFRQLQTSYDRQFEGTGLGLSVVKGLAALHGGRLEIASRLGVGTRAAVILPQGEAMGAAGKVAPAKPVFPNVKANAERLSA